MPTRVRIVYSRFPTIPATATAATAQAVATAAKAIEANVHEKMRAPKSGRTYLIGGKTHTASAPGEAPAVLTGELIGSVVAEQKSALTWIVPAEGEGAFWEFGLRGLPARPYFRPAVDEESAGFAAGVGAAIKVVEHG